MFVVFPVAMVLAGSHKHLGLFRGHPSLVGSKHVRHASVCSTSARETCEATVVEQAAVLKA